MEIGALKLKSRVFLAPMLEVNDLPFRILCKKAGAGLVYTGMVNPLSKKHLQLDDCPALQIFTNDSKGIREFIKKHEAKVCLFDFNLGCPSKVARKLGFGAFLHEKLELIEEILKIMRSTTKKPITLKLRKSPNAFKILKIAEKYVDAVAIHPRTDEQGYSGDPDLNFARLFKSKTKLPVIYSGNVDERNYKSLLEEFDFVMVGRRAIGDPNIFSRISGAGKTNFDYLDWLALEERYPQPFRQIKFQAMFFTKRKKNAKELRRKLALAKTKEEVRRVWESSF